MPATCSWFFPHFLSLLSLFSSEGSVNKRTSQTQLVLMTVRVHPFPSRTRQLSSLVPTILGWKRPGKIGRCQHKRQPPRRNPWRFVFCLYIFLFYRHRFTANLNTELNCGNMARYVPYSRCGNAIGGLQGVGAASSGPVSGRRFSLCLPYDSFGVLEYVAIAPYSEVRRVIRRALKLTVCTYLRAASSGLVK